MVGRILSHHWKVKTNSPKHRPSQAVVAAPQALNTKLCIVPYLARLVDYDVCTQIAKVQSCFHQQYPSNTPSAEDVPMEVPPQSSPEQQQPKPAPTTDTIDLVSSDSEPEQEYTSMLTPLEEPISNDHAVRNNTSSSRTTTRLDNNAASSNSTTTHQEGVIDLTSDVEDDMDEIEYTQPGEVSFWDTPTPTPTPTPDHQRSREKSVRLSLEPVETEKAEQIHPPCSPGMGTGKQRADTSRCVDDDRHPSPSVSKGKQRAEPRNVNQGRQDSHRPKMDLNGKQHRSPSVDQVRQTRPSKDQNEKQHEEQKEDDPPKQPQRPPESQPPPPPPPSPRTAPTVQLWVDTQLLGPWMYEPRALFEFSGQVVFDRTLGDDSGLSVGSRASNESGIRREGPGQWVMLAKSARNMEGLDLHAYRHSVLRIRELMQDGI